MSKFDPDWMRTMAGAMQGIPDPARPGDEFARQVREMLETVDALAGQLSYDDEPSGFARALARHKEGPGEGGP